MIIPLGVRISPESATLWWVVVPGIIHPATLPRSVGEGFAILTYPKLLLGCCCCWPTRPNTALRPTLWPELHLVPFQSKLITQIICPCLRCLLTINATGKHRIGISAVDIKREVLKQIQANPITLLPEHSLYAIPDMAVLAVYQIGNRRILQNYLLSLLKSQITLRHSYLYLPQKTP